MLIKTFITALLVSSATSAMERTYNYRVFSEEDSNGDVWIKDEHGGMIKETYPNFFYSLDKTANADDIKQHFSIPQALFIQLVVQASKIKQLDTIPFHELLDRVRSGKIEAERETIAVTHKDAEHRLLSYIPTGKVVNKQLVNDKKIRMTIILGSRLVDKPDKSIVRTGAPKVEEDFPLDPAGFPCYEFLAAQKARRGKETELTGEDRLSSNYDFASDQEHHAKIVAEFNGLFQNKLP
jgi:hypothetical protein